MHHANFFAVHFDQLIAAVQRNFQWIEERILCIPQMRLRNWEKCTDFGLRIEALMLAVHDDFDGIARLGALNLQRNGECVQVAGDTVVPQGKGIEVQQINKAALKIMNLRSESDILGDQVVRVLDPADFIEVLKTGRSIHNKREYLAEYEKYVEFTVVCDKEYRLLVCIMRDVTDEELAKEAAAFSKEVHDAIEANAVASLQGFGRVYAYETDGFGQCRFMDDAIGGSRMAASAVPAAISRR